jgi:hypothetical protein
MESLGSAYDLSKVLKEVSSEKDESQGQKEGGSSQPSINGEVKTALDKRGLYSADKPETIVDIKSKEFLKEFKSILIEDRKTTSKLVLTEKRGNPIKRSQLSTLGSNVQGKDIQVSNGISVDAPRYQLPSFSEQFPMVKLSATMYIDSDDEVNCESSSPSPLKKFTISHLRRKNTIVVADSSIMKIVKMQAQLRKKVVPHMPDLTLKFDNSTTTAVPNQGLSGLRKPFFQKRVPFRKSLSSERDAEVANFQEMILVGKGKSRESCGPKLKLQSTCDGRKQLRNVLATSSDTRRKFKSTQRTSLEREKLDFSLIGHSLNSGKEKTGNFHFQSLLENRPDSLKGVSVSPKRTSSARKQSVLFQKPQDNQSSIIKSSRRSLNSPPKLNGLGVWRGAIPEACQPPLSRTSPQGFSFFQVRRVSQKEKDTIPVKRATLLNEMLPICSNPMPILKTLKNTIKSIL